MLSESESLAGRLNTCLELLVFEVVIRYFAIRKLPHFSEQPEQVDVEFVFWRKLISQADQNLKQEVNEDFPAGLQELVLLKRFDLDFSTCSPVEVGRVVRAGRALLDTAPLIHEEMCG